MLRQQLIQTLALLFLFACIVGVIMFSGPMMLAEVYEWLHDKTHVALATAGISGLILWVLG